MNIRSILTFILIFIVLGLAVFLTSPPTDDLGKYSVSMEGLSVSQKSNICHASRLIDMTSLWPGEEFSFNKIVGPRKVSRGFSTSAVIFEGEKINAVGGGICLLSSAIYNAVLLANLDVVERVAHTAPVRSVPIGRDATVWYGQNDLKFINNTDHKIVVNAKCYLNRLNIVIKGKGELNPASIEVKKSKISDNKIEVRVYKTVNGNTKKVSEDIYSYKTGYHSLSHR